LRAEAAKNAHFHLLKTSLKNREGRRMTYAVHGRVGARGRIYETSCSVVFFLARRE
jgi:hypothetical protein